MSFNLGELRQALALDGARPSQFTVEIYNPFNNIAALKIPISVQAASLPASQIGQIEVPYFGRPEKFAGDRTYDNWSVSILNDEDFQIRNAFEQWHSAINSVIGNVRRDPGLGYKSVARVTQYAKTGEVIRAVRLNGLWPVLIGEIPLAWSAANQIEQFGVTFSVDNWETIPGPTGSGD